MTPLEELIGESTGIRAVRETVGRLLQRHSDARRLPPILIQGETGTGKGLLARAIHRMGPRRSGPFVDVNCAAIPETLLEAELFGFERGAFTDARRAKPGLFQTAHRGSLFLDEIGLLPEGLQGKLLTVIEERAVRPLGSTRSEPADVWLIAASNEDLTDATRQGRFREDLYHRLAVVTLTLPPLRERGEDVLVLAERFLARACADYDLPPKALAPDTRAVLLAYPWPGNIRELGNVMERVALFAEARLVTAEMLRLPDAPAASAPGAAGAGPAPAAMGGDDAVARLQRERDELVEALRETGWNVSRAAARLRLPRNTLRYRIKKHGLRPETAAPARRRPERTAPAPAPVRPAPVAPAAPAPVPMPLPRGVRWERRHVALLHVALAGEPDAEPAPEATRALELVVEKVQSFGGRTDELGPTGLVAAFGLEPVEDAPRRAAHAAMAIQKVAERARRATSEAIPVRLAVHAGQYLVGEVTGAAQIDLDAKREAWGLLRALAARAEAGAILVSAGAAPSLERGFELEPVGALPGALGPAYRLAGLERTGLGLGPRLGRFVGRGHDLDLLESRLGSAIEGRGQVVGIGGEAGIGKSRLLFEFRQRLAARRIAYLEGQCQSYATTTPYVPMLDLLRGFCGIAEADTPEAIVEKVRHGLERVGLRPAERAPYLLHLLGIKEGTEGLDVLSPEAIKARRFETVRQLLLSESRRHPLVVAVENVHWIDRSSEEFFAWLADGLTGAAILLVFTYRPGYGPPWIGRSYATQTALQPLAPHDSLAVVRSVMQTEEVPHPVAQVILGKAEGNPFFLEELARSLVERGDLGAPGTVPDTVQEVLVARIDRLPAEPRRLLQTTAILGREVSAWFLRAVWGDSPGFDASLQELMRLEFLYEQSDATEPVYVFKHALTREVARESLPVAERQKLHAAAGRALERLYAERLEEAYARLAYHYSKAKQADKAVEYLTLLADKAARSHAHAEAVAALDEALSHAERLPAEARGGTVVELLLRQTHSLSFLGRFPEALALLLRERPRLERPDLPASGVYHFWLAHTYSYLGDHAQAEASAARALAEAERWGDKATLGKTYVVLAQESHWFGEPARGIEHGRRAVDLLEHAGDRWWLGLAHWVVGINHIAIGDLAPALRAQHQALAVGEAMGDPRLQSYATWSAGWIQALAGDPDAGIEACRRALDRAIDPLNTAVALGHLGYVHVERGDAVEAIPLLEQSLAQVRQFRFRRLEGRFATFLGEAYLASGQLGKARELLEQGLEITREADYRYGVAWARQALGRLAWREGRLADAELQLSEALRAFDALQARLMAGRSHLALAEVTHARGQAGAAAAHLRAAHDLFRALSVERYAARAATRLRELGISL